MFSGGYLIMANPANSNFEPLIDDMKMEIILQSDLKGACSVAQMGRDWYPTAMNDTLWRIFASRLGMANRTQGMNPHVQWVPINVTVRGHVINIGKIAKRVVDKAYPGNLIKHAKGLLKEEISIANTVALEACLVRRWVSMVTDNIKPLHPSQPEFVNQLLAQEFSVENTKQIKEWLKVRDTFVVWSALVNQCSLQFPLPLLNSFLTLEDAQEAASQFPKWCEANKQALMGLQELNLRWIGLTEVPEIVGFLQNLKKLDLGCNLLSKLPDSISGLNNLTELKLGSNYFTIIPACIFHLSQIERLDVSENGLQSVPDMINFLSKLTHLSLTNNSLQTIPDCIGLLKNLQELHLGSNVLSDLPDGLRNLVQLTEIGLYSNQFGTQPNFINVLPNLRTASIWGNPLHLDQWILRNGVGRR